MSFLSKVNAIIIGAGQVYHSVHFNDVMYNEAIGKKVVVVGIGNSAVDVACNCAAAGR